MWFHTRNIQTNFSADGWDISCETAGRWMSLDFSDDKSTLVQGMAWCRQATSHYLSQCWPRSMMPYGLTRPQWVNSVVIIVHADEVPGHLQTQGGPSLDPASEASKFHHLTMVVNLGWLRERYIIARCHQPRNHHIRQCWTRWTMS